MTDKHKVMLESMKHGVRIDLLMDEVMRELIEYCKQKDIDGDCARYMDTGECAECSFALTRKACRSYARKVMEGIFDRHHPNADSWSAHILSLIHRLTDKEPTKGSANKKLISNNLADKEQT